MLDSNKLMNLQLVSVSSPKNTASFPCFSSSFNLDVFFLPNLLNYEIKKDIWKVWTKIVAQILGYLGVYKADHQCHSGRSSTTSFLGIWAQKRQWCEFEKAAFLHLPCHYVQTFVRWTLNLHHPQRAKQRTNSSIFFYCSKLNRLTSHQNSFIFSCSFMYLFIPSSFFLSLFPLKSL